MENPAATAQQFVESISHADSKRWILDAIDAAGRPITFNSVADALLQNVEQLVDRASEDGFSPVLAPFLTAPGLSAKARQEILRQSIHCALMRGHWHLLRSFAEHSEGGLTVNDCFMESAECLAQIGFWEAVEEALQAISDRHFRAVCLGVLISPTPEQPGPIDKELKSNGFYNRLVAVLQAAAISSWDVVMGLIKAESDADTRTLICLATISHATLRWNWVRELAVIATSPRAKYECFRKAFWYQEQSTTADFTNHMLRTIPDNLTKDQFCLAAVRRAAAASEWALVTQLVDQVSDAGIKDQCCLAAVPLAGAASQMDLAISLVQTISSADIAQEACLATLSRVEMRSEGNSGSDELCHQIGALLSVALATDEVTRFAFTAAIDAKRIDLACHLMSLGFEPDLESPEGHLDSIATLDPGKMQDFATELARAFQGRVNPTVFLCIQKGHTSLATSLLSQSQQLD